MRASSPPARAGRLVTLALAAAASAAIGPLALAAPAGPPPPPPPPSQPQPPRPDPVAQLQAENQQLRAQLAGYQAAYQSIWATLDRIDQLNQRSRDRATRRDIDRALRDARAQAGVGPSGGGGYGDDRDRDGDRDHHGRDRDHDHDRDHDRDRGPRALSDAAFQDLRNSVANASFEEDRLTLVRAAAAASAFTADQIAALMQTSAFDDTRVEIAGLLAPHAVDPQRLYVLYDALQFSSSRDSLRQRLGQ